MDIKEAYLSFISGHENAFEYIIEEYKDTLIFFVMRYVKNITDAEDIVENVFFKLAVKKPKYKNSNKFSTWLYTIARNEAISFLRKEKHRSSDDISEYENLADVENDIEASFVKEERNRFIHEALGKLPDAYREVLHLSFFAELKNEEIAKITGKSRKQVENLLYRAKIALKKELEKEGFDYENSF